MKFRLRYFSHNGNHLSIGIDREIKDKTPMGDFGFWNEESHTPFVKALLGSVGVTMVRVRSYEIFLEKTLALSWDEVLPKVLGVIHFYFDAYAEMSEAGVPVRRYGNGRTGEIHEEEIAGRYELALHPPLIPLIFSK